MEVPTGITLWRLCAEVWMVGESLSPGPNDTQDQQWYLEKRSQRGGRGSHMPVRFLDADKLGWPGLKAWQR